MPVTDMSDCILALIPLLASCGDKSLSVSETVKAINGEDAEGVKHDSANVLKEYSKVTSWVDMDVTSLKAVEEGSTNEEKVAYSTYLMNLELKEQLSHWCLYEYAFDLFSGLGQGASQALNEGNVDNYVNAMSLLNVFEEYTTSDEKYGNDKSVKEYPHTDNMSYNYKSRHLSLNYTLTGSLSIEKFHVEYIEKKKLIPADEKLHIGFALNVKAEYNENGEMREFSFVASSAHKAKPGDNNDHFAESSYYIAGNAVVTYEK